MDRACGGREPAPAPLPTEEPGDGVGGGDPESGPLDGMRSSSPHWLLLALLLLELLELLRLFAEPTPSNCFGLMEKSTVQQLCTSSSSKSGPGCIQEFIVLIKFTRFS